MRIENILREQVYTFCSSPKVDEVEREIINQIFAKEHIETPSDALLIDNNDNYDSFKVVTPKTIYCLKFSLDTEYDGLHKDFACLNELHTKVSPRPIVTGSIKKYHAQYSISSFLCAPNLNEAGKVFASQNVRALVDSYRHINKATVAVPSCEQWFAANYFDDNIEKSLGDIDFSQDAEILEICTTELNNLRAILKENYRSHFNQPTLCHGNITPSKILVLNGAFAFLNFENAYSGSPLLDLCSLKYEFGFDDLFEGQLVREYYKDQLLPKQQYQETRKFVQALKFYDLIREFIKQIYIYRGTKQKKILELTEKMSRSFGFFTGLEPFERHKQKIGELFTNSVI